MNYLAHLALSHDNSDVMLGNFIGDFVKGSNYSRYSPSVRQGILLHRKIDAFTDAHPVVRASCELLKDTYGRYAGIIVDMFYDHFLALNWDTYHKSMPLSRFVSKTHRVLMFNYFRLPNEVKSMLPSLIKSRRLENYANLAGLARALNIMARHTSLPNNTGEAIRCLNENYILFGDHFGEFFPQVTAMVDEELKGVGEK